MNFRFGADIDSTRRFVEQQHVAARGQPAREHDLLLVAARERGSRHVEPRRPHAQPVEEWLRVLALAAAVDEGQSREPLEDRERRVGENAHRQHEALTFTVFRDEADAVRNRALRRRMLDGTTVYSDAARDVRIEAEDGLGNLRPARADKAGNAEHFTGAKCERDIRKAGGTRQSFDPQQLGAGVGPNRRGKVLGR